MEEHSILGGVVVDGSDVDGVRAIECGFVALGCVLLYCVTACLAI